MKKIDLDKIYETFIRVSIPFDWNRYIDILRSKVSPLISELQNKKIIKWYCFLLHSKKSGVPTTDNDQNPYIHIRLELIKKINVDKLDNFLPSYCLMTRKVDKKSLEKITGIDNSLLKDYQIQGAWQIIGETSVWILKMLNAHSSDKKITQQQVVQFLHYFGNALQIENYIMANLTMKVLEAVTERINK